MYKFYWGELAYICYTLHPSAIAKLPPNKRITLHGNIFSTSSQTISGEQFSPLNMFRRGQAIRQNRTRTAVVVSVMSSGLKSACQPGTKCRSRVSQRRIATKNHDPIDICSHLKTRNQNINIQLLCFNTVFIKMGPN